MFTVKDIIYVDNHYFKNTSSLDCKITRPAIIIHEEEDQLYYLAMESNKKLYYRLKNFLLKKEHTGLEKDSIIDLRLVSKTASHYRPVRSTVSNDCFQVLIASLIETQEALKRRYGVCDADYLEIEDKLKDKIPKDILADISLIKERYRTLRMNDESVKYDVHEEYLSENVEEKYGHQLIKKQKRKYTVWKIEKEK